MKDGERYNAAQSLMAMPLCERSDHFVSCLGGEMRGPDKEPSYFEEHLWCVKLHGIESYALSRTEAIAKWIKQAMLVVGRPSNIRASDHRPVCPYDGQPEV